MMLKIGLTGSIAVGKSFVCACFRELGCHVLDADETAREVVRPGTDGLRRIAEAFGSDILTAEGDLDRKKLGAIVFADFEKRKLLNSIVHPLVMDVQDRWIEERKIDTPDGIAIIDAALMIESGGYKRFDKIIVVWCAPAIQLQRLIARDGISPKAAKQRIAAQMPQKEKKRFADYMIDTSAGLDAARDQVAAVFNKVGRTD